MAFLEHTPNSALFQYTNFAGFEGLLKSKCIWLSDLKSTNDPRELVLGQHVLNDAIAKVRHECFPGARGLPLSILAANIAGYLANQGMFSASFTYRPDALPMWREYGDGGAGIAIGFRPRALTDMPVRIQKVEYLEDNGVAAWAKLIQELLRPYRDLEDIGAIVRDLNIVTPLISTIVAAKHASWSYEGEVRLTHAAESTNIRQQVNGITIPSYEYPDGTPYFSTVLVRQRNDEAVNYVSLPFGKYSGKVHQPAQALEKIVLGPKCSYQVDQIEKMLSDAGYTGFAIVRSECALK